MVFLFSFNYLLLSFYFLPRFKKLKLFSEHLNKDYLFKCPWTLFHVGCCSEKIRWQFAITAGLGFRLYVYTSLEYSLIKPVKPGHMYFQTYVQNLEQNSQICTFGLVSSLHSNASVFFSCSQSTFVYLLLLNLFDKCLIYIIYHPWRWTGEDRDIRVWITSSSRVTSIAIWVTDTAMSSSGCCHLPGSLCDYSGNAESDASKDSEESDSTMQAQYIAKVTAKDGRPLSTVVKAVSLQRFEGEEPEQHAVESSEFLSSPFCCVPLLYSDMGMCRICHEGAGGETLLSPCDCTGTLGKVHKSCLEKWLSSSNTSYCELCHTEFTIERRPQPLTQVSRILSVWGEHLEGCAGESCVHSPQLAQWWDVTWPYKTVLSGNFNFSVEKTNLY